MQKSSLFLALIILLFTSCEKSSNNNIIDEKVIQFVELNASQYEVNILDSLVTGKFEKFSFSEGDTVIHDNWDVAFRSTSIIVNGGIASDSSQPNRTGNAAVYITVGEMGDIISVDSSLLMQRTLFGISILLL